MLDIHHYSSQMQAAVDAAVDAAPASTVLADFMLQVGPFDCYCASGNDTGRVWAAHVAADVPLATQLLETLCGIQGHLSRASAGPYMVPVLGWVTHAGAPCMAASSECGRRWLQLLHGAAQDCYATSDGANLTILATNVLDVLHAVGTAHAVRCAATAATWLQCLRWLCLGSGVSCGSLGRPGYVALMPIAAKLAVRFVDHDAVVAAFMHLCNDVVWEPEDAPCVVLPLLGAVDAVVTWRAGGTHYAAECAWAVTTLAAAAAFDAPQLVTAGAVEVAAAAVAVLVSVPSTTSAAVLDMYLNTALQVVRATVGEPAVVAATRARGPCARAALARSAAAGTRVCALVEAFAAGAGAGDTGAAVVLPSLAAHACALKQEMYAVFVEELAHTRGTCA
jgi:hypothetical protein